MRQRISDRNILPTFDLETEYKKLHELFFQKGVFGRLLNTCSRTRPSLSYDDCLQTLFLDWELRGTFTSIEEMLFALEISEDHFDKGITEDRFLDYIQFILNAVAFVDGCAKSGEYVFYQATDSVWKAIVDNCNSILSRLGAELINSDKELFVTYKNDVASTVYVKNEKLSDSIIEYLKIDNRGDIIRKGEILCTLAKQLEMVEKQLNATEFKNLCSDTTFLLNKIGARHAQNPQQRIEAKFLSMSETELENWYDRTFDLVLACMSVLPYVDIKSDIKEIKN